MAGLTIQSLRGFVTLVDEGSFSAAAKRLGVTQPAISAQLKALEDHFGARLMERAEGGWRPTAAGERLYDHARQIAAAAESMETSMASRWEGLSGRLRILASTVPGECLLPKLLGDFSEAFPAVQVSLQVSDSSSVVDQLLLRRADLGVIGAEGPFERLDLRPFATDELLLVCPSDHPLSRARSIKLDHLVFQPWIMRQRGSGTRAAVARALAGVGIDSRRLPVVLELGGTEAVKRAVKAGVGLSFVSCYCLEPEDVSSGISVLSVPALTVLRPLSLALERDRLPRAPVQAILDFLASEKVARRLDGWKKAWRFRLDSSGQ